VITCGALSVSNGTFNTSADSGTWTIGSNGVTISGGTLTATSGTFNIAGGLSNTGTFVNNSATLTFNAISGTPTITSLPANGEFNNILFNDGDNGVTFSLGSAIDVANDLTITGGTLDAAGYAINVGGDWDNNDLFTHNDNLVFFDSGSTDKTIEAGASSFYDLEFDSASGGWTIQTNDLTVSNDLTITDTAATNGLIVEANRTIIVNGEYSTQEVDAATTWNTGTTLNLTKSGGGVYTVNSKTAGADTYVTLTVGADTDIRIWNSSAAIYSVNATGSLYSMDHATTDGDLYIWGDYYVPADSTDYWSYATDFDGTDLTGSQRQVDVRLADIANVTCASGETLNVNGLSGNVTAISRNGLGSYGVDINDGTINANYYSFEYLDGTGLNISGSSTTIGNLSNGDFDNSAGSGGTDTFITVAGATIDNNPALTITGINFDNTNSAADYNVTATGSTTTYWDFDSTTGTFDGELGDSDPMGNPGYIIWDDSATATINISGIAYTDSDEATPVPNGTNIAIAVNDYYENFTTTTSGNFSFTSIGVDTGDILTFYFDGEAFSGSCVVATDGSDITTLRLYQNHVITGFSTVGSLSIAQMATYDSDDDADINFDAEDAATDTLVTDSTSTLFIPTSFIFNPGGNLEDGASGVGSIDIRGTLTLAGSQIIRVLDSWDNSGTFNVSNSHIKFAASSGSPTIDTNATNFYDLSFVGSTTYTLASNLGVTNSVSVTGGTLDLSTYTLTSTPQLTIDGGTLTATTGDINLNNDLVLSSGTLNAPNSSNTFNISGNYTNSGGNFISSTGKVIFDAPSGTQTVNAGGTGDTNKDFNDLQKSGGGIIQLNSSALEVDGTLTLDSGLTFELNGQSLNIPGTLDNKGTVKMLGSEVSVSIATMDTAEGEVVYTGDGDASPENFTLKDFGVGNDYYDLIINDLNATKDTFRTNANLTVAGTLDVLAGTLDISTNSNTLTTTGIFTINGGTVTATDGSIDANTDLTLTSGVLTAPDSGGYLRFAADLDLSGGTFTHSSGTIESDAAGGTPILNAGTNNLSSLEVDVSVTLTLASAITLANNLTITNGTLDTGTDYAINLAGSWDNNSTFTANNSLVTFNATTTGKTIEAGASSFYDIEFDSSSGGWTIQTNDLTASNNFTITDTAATNGLIVEANRTITVNGEYLTQEVDAATTWNTGTTLNLTKSGGGAYTANSKTTGADTYVTLTVGADTDIRIWNSSAATYSVNATGSLYSMDHATTNGDLYIWGDYYVPTDSTDHWSYTTDFDGTDLTASERQVDVRLADTTNITAASGETLNIIGSSGNETAISRNGSGSYGVDISDGTINANYYSFEYLDGTGLNITGLSVSISSLSNGSFDNSAGAGSTDTFITVAAASIDNNPALTITGVNFDNTNSNADYNVTATGSSISYWDFDSSTGTFDSERDDSDPAGNPGYLIFDDSATAQVDISGAAFTDSDEVTPVTNGTNIALAVNGYYETVVTTTSGNFSFTNIGVDTGDILTFYFDGEAFRGSCVMVTDASDVTTLRLYQDHVITGFQTVGSLSIAQMSVYDSDDDADINFDAEDSTTDTLVTDSTSGLLIPTSFAFQPGGDLESGANGIGHLNIKGTLTCTSSEIIRVMGEWDNSGTFNPASSHVKFAASSGTPSIDTNATSFYDLSFIGSTTYTLSSDLGVDNSFMISGGELNTSTYTITSTPQLTINGGTLNAVNGNIDLNNNLLLSSGALNAPGDAKSFTILGNYTNSGGNFIGGIGKVTFDAPSGTQTVNAGGTGDTNKDFNDLTKSGGGILQLTGTALEVDGTILVSSGAEFELNGQSLNLGILDNKGIVKMLGSESSVTITTMDVAEGEVVYTGDGDVAAEVFILKDFGVGLDYYDLTINDTNGTKDTFRTNANLSVNNQLEVLAGTIDISTNGNTLTISDTATINGGILTATDGNITASSDFTLTIGTLNAPTSGQAFNIAGSLDLAGTYNASTGKITMNATSGTPTFDSGGNDLYDLDFDDSGNTITFTLNSAIVLDNDLTITNGTLNTGSNYAITLGGNWVNEGLFVSNTSLVTFNKASGTQTIDAGGTGDNNTDFQDLTKSGNGTLQLTTSALEVDGTLIISSGLLLDLNGENLTVATLDNSGTIELEGGEAVSITTMDTASGAVRYVGTDGGTTHSIGGFGAATSDFYNLIINDGNTTKDTFTTTEDFHVYNTFQIDGGTLNAASYNFETDSIFTITSGAVTAPGTTKDLILGDDFIVAGTFNANSGEVVFDTVGNATTIDAPGAGLSFYDFTCNTASKVINFGAGDTFTVSNTLTMDGSAVGTRIDLNSTTPDTMWNLILNGTDSLQYLDVKDSNASGTVTFPLNPIGSYNSGNNNGWFPLANAGDANALRSGADRHTIYDGSYFWAFYIDDNSDVVYKRSSDSSVWVGDPTVVAGGTYSSIGIWDDDTDNDVLYCAYSDGLNSYIKSITISTQSMSAETEIPSASGYHSQITMDTSGYLHRKGERKSNWIVKNYRGTLNGATTTDVDITPISNANRAFIFAPAGHMTVGSGTGDGAQNANQVFVRAKFNGTDQVTLTRGSATSASEYCFYVIEEVTGDEIYVESGSTAFTGATDADLTVGLTGITDYQDCVVFLTTSTDAAGLENQAAVKGYVDASDNLQLTRTATASTVTVDWFVVEFKGAGWTVQQGDFTADAGTVASPETQGLAPSVTAANSFAYMNFSADTEGLAQSAPTIELTTDGSTLNFARQATTGTCSARYYVISNSNMDVQRGGDAALSTDVAEVQAITAVDLGRSVPLTFHDTAGTGTAFPRSYWRTWFSDSTTINMERNYQGQAANIHWQAIEFPEDPVGFYWMRSTSVDDATAWNAEEKIAEDTDGFGHIQIVPLASGNAMAIYNDYTTDTYNLRYKLYNSGTGLWGSELTVASDCKTATTSADWDDNHYFSLMSDISGTDYLIYLIYIDSVTGYVEYMFYDSDTTSWSPAYTVSNSGACSDPSIFYDETYGTFYAFWINSDAVKYKRKIGNGWPTDEVILKADILNPKFLNVAYSDTDKISVMWREGTGTHIDFGEVTLTATIVSLTELYAIGLDASVKVIWETEAEIDNEGFNIYRSLDANGDYTQINSSIISGLGTSMSGQSYNYLDSDIAGGNTYYYILESVEYDGKTRMFGPVVANPGRDSDGDGMSDDYEYFYGLDPSSNDAGNDPDSDGLTNAEEYAALSDPYSSVDVALSWDASTPGTAGLTTIESTDTSITLELITNEFDTSNKVYGVDTYQLISFPEYSHSYNEDAGKPMIPYKGVLVSMAGKIPVTIEVLGYDKEELTGYNIYPVTQKEITVAGGVTYYEKTFFKDSNTYSLDALYPNKLADVDYSSYLRGQNVAKIKLMPLQFNPVTQSIEFYNRLRIKLTFAVSSASTAASGGSGVPSGTADAYKLEVNQDGIHRVTYSELNAAGLSVSTINPKNFKLYFKGTQIPIHVEGEADNTFDSGDYIEFYGLRHTEDRYTYSNVYWLTFDAVAGTRMSTKTSAGGITPASFMSAKMHELNEFYWSEIEGAADPFYFYPWVRANDNEEFDIDLTDAVTTSNNNSQISIGLQGFNTMNYPNYHVKLYINDYVFEDLTWDDDDAYSATIEIPSYWLIDGTNTLKLEHVRDDADYPNVWVFLDWVEISYRRQFKAVSDYLKLETSGIGDYTFEVTNFVDSDIKVYDITDTNNVKQISSPIVVADSGKYKVTFNDATTESGAYSVVSDSGVNSVVSITADTASTLRTATNRADYIMITVDDYYDELAPLEVHREAQGLTVLRTKLTDVYDEFNYGIPSPQAIKNFLSYAYSNWTTPAPTYVLLVGDASYDFRDDEWYGFTNYLPTYFVYSEDFGEASTDGWFVCFDGETDIYPDMLIGRFPARTEAHATNMVNKTIAYEGLSLTADWTNDLIFVADDETKFEVITDFLSDEDNITSSYTATKKYLSNYASGAAARSDIISAINDGALMVTYSGHGGVEIWADEQILRVSDVDSLTNTNKYPFVLTLNCINGYFEFPDFYECLSEELVRAEDKGAVAVLAPSGMSLPEEQRVLAEGLYDSIFKNKERIVGSAVANAKLYLHQEAADASSDVIQNFNLFGDPALILRKEATTVSDEPDIPTVYSFEAEVASALFSFSYSQDTESLYPTILFEEEPVVIESKQGKKLKDQVESKTATITELIPVPKQLAFETMGTEDEFVGEGLEERSKNKIIHLGAKEKQIIQENDIESKKAKDVLAKEGKEEPELEISFWEKVSRAISEFIDSVFGKK